MRPLIILGAMFLLAISMATAASIPNNKIDVQGKAWNITGHMVFRGNVGGHYVEHNGTIQDVVAQVKKLNPGFTPQPFDKSLNHTKITRENNLEERQIHDSGAYVSGRFCCPVPGQWFDRTSRDATWSNIHYLQYDVDGWCGVGSGPGSCVQVAATHDNYLGGCSSLILCNNDQWFKNFDCGWIANLAIDLMNNCGYAGDYSRWACGQEFANTYSHGWGGNGNMNIIITRTNC